MNPIPFSFFKAPAGGGGGSPTWYYNETSSGVSTTGGVSAAGQIFGGTFVAPISGTVDKISVLVGDAGGVGDGKLAAMTTGGTPLGSAYYPGSTAGSHVEVSVTPFAVTASTTYVIFPMASSGAGLKPSYKTVTGEGRENYDQVYASFPNGTVSMSNTNTRVVCGMRITP